MVDVWAVVVVLISCVGNMVGVVIVMTIYVIDSEVGVGAVVVDVSVAVVDDGVWVAVW